MVKRRGRRPRRRIMRGRRRFRGRRLLGGLTRGRQHPSTSTASPWNQLAMFTIFTSGGKAGPECVTTDTIRGSLKKELGLNDKTTVDLRLIRIDVWTMPMNANSANNTIVFAPMDWSSRDQCATPSVIDWYEAWGTAVQPAHLHYVWPISISNRVISEVSFPLFQFDVIAGTKLLMKVHILWRANTPDPRPTSASIVTLREYRHGLQPPPPGVDWDVIDDDQMTRPVIQSVADLTV